MQAAAALTRADYEEKRRAIMAFVQADLDALEAEYTPAFVVADERATALSAEAKAAVLALGATVKGTNLQAVYMRGRQSWDSKALGGYAAAHPEIMQFQSIGEPSVSIRTVKA